MPATGLFRSTVLIVILLFNLGCDQISKNFVRNKLQYYEEIKFLDSHIMLTRVENPGAFLSVGHTLSGDLRFFTLIFVPLMALVIGIYFLLYKTHLPKSTLLALSFVIGGGFGNIFDRYFYGAVTDFLHVDFVLFRTGIFNMADVSIMTGVFIMIFAAIRDRQQKSISITGDSIEESTSVRL